MQSTSNNSIVDPIRIENISSSEVTDESIKLDEARNNSITEKLMIEDISASNLSTLSEPIVEDKSIKYTCNACMFVTTNKIDIDEHVEIRHSVNMNEDVRFVCKECGHEFKEADDYDGHVRKHEMENKKEETDFCQLNNVVLNLILDQYEYEVEVMPKYDMILESLIDDNKTNSDVNVTASTEETPVQYQCDKCDVKFELETDLKAHFETVHEHKVQYQCDKCEVKYEIETDLIAHIQTAHKHPRVNVSPGPCFKCDICEYVCDLNIKLKKHTEREYKGK